MVTGANGYLGRATVAALVAAGHEPIALMRAMFPTRGVAVRVADLLDEPALQQALTGVDAVCHLAGLTHARESFADPLAYFRVNAGGTFNLLGAMTTCGVPRLAFASTASIYGTPDRQPMTELTLDAPPHPYAASKLAAEYAIRAQANAAGMSAIILRLLNIAGGDDPDPTRLVPRTLAAAADNSSLEVNGDGSAVRDYVHVTDVAAAFVAAFERMPEANSTSSYIIGSGNGTSVLDVVASVERVTGRTIPLVHRPPASEPAALIGDSTKARTELSWRPQYSDIDTIVRDSWRV
nr:NAD-dependent epimerase/dehydratase family protein [Nocardia transvalensis]